MKKNKSKSKKRSRNRYNDNSHVSFSVDSVSSNRNITNDNNHYANVETIIYPLPNALKLPINTIVGYGNQTSVYFIWLFCALICALTSFILWEVILEKILFIAIETILLVSFYILLKRFNKTVGYCSIDNDGFRFICVPSPKMNVEILWENICPEYVAHIETGGRYRPDYLVFKYKNTLNESKKYKLPIENWINGSPLSPIEKRKLMLKTILKGLARIPNMKINQHVFTKLDVDPKTFEFSPSKRKSENMNGIIFTITILGICFMLWVFLSSILPPSWALGLLLLSIIPIVIGLILLINWLEPESENNISYSDNINKSSS
uniref:Uncharacterized protein n=1 Tax=Providencia stuartii TaxID=588 RepID=A0AAI9GHI3_PROST|nr:hypothetical protein [Providencia stuartii]